MIKRGVRNLNGYRVVYKPEHPSSMKTDNWEGYVYEHIYVAETKLGRRLSPGDVVHHLNGDRSDNRWHNLLVVSKSEHMKLHMWINAGAPGLETLRENGVNSWKAGTEPNFCTVCGEILENRHAKRHKACQKENEDTYRQENWPSKEQLAEDMKSMSWVAMGKKYGVSDNAMRKRARKLGLLC